MPTTQVVGSLDVAEAAAARSAGTLAQYSDRQLRRLEEARDIVSGVVSERERLRRDAHRERDRQQVRSRERQRAVK